MEKIEGTVVAPQTSMVNVEMERAVAEAQSAMIIAKRFPRDPIKALDRITNACTRMSLAKDALYEYSRGGTAITGPSIRLAEVLAQNWGNLTCGVIELNRRQGESDCMAYAWDLETNFRDEKRFTIAHLRDTKGGSHRVESERDIYEVLANQAARRKRACILAVIPGDITEAAVAQVEVTLKTQAEVTPERIQNMVEMFSAHGVSKAQLEKKIQKRLDAMSPGQLIVLSKIYNSLKDGMSTPSDWFEMEEQPVKGDTLKDKLRKQVAPEPVHDVPEPEPTAPKRTRTRKEPEPKKIDPLACTQCNFVASTEQGLINHCYRTHSNKTEPEPIAQPSAPVNNGMANGRIYVFCPMDQKRLSTEVCENDNGCEFMADCGPYQEGIAQIGGERL